MELLAQRVEGLSQAEIAKELGRSPNETYRVLATLVRRGYVLKDFSGERYQLSLRMFTLSHRHPPLSRMIEQALPLMRDAALRAQQSCHISVEEAGQIVILASIEAPGNWGLSLRSGSIIGLYNTTSGHILAAFRSRSDLEHMITSHKLADGERPMARREFESTLDQVRKQGFGLMKSATAMGVTNLGYPVLGSDGHAIAALVCPYLERIDAHIAPSLESVAQIFSSVAAKLSFSPSTSTDIS